MMGGRFFVGECFGGVFGKVCGCGGSILIRSGPLNTDSEWILVILGQLVQTIGDTDGEGNPNWT